MHEHQIEEMAKLIGKRLRLKVADIGHVHIRQALKTYWNDKVAITWRASDVQLECPGLTDDEAIDVLIVVLENNDADHGVTWDTIHTVAEQLFGKRAFKRRPADRRKKT